MKLWIRVDAAVRSDPKVAELADRLKIPFPEAVGMCVLVWGAIAEHRPNGDVSGIPFSTFDRWAGHSPRKGFPREAFGKAFVDLFTSDDEASGWHNRQGALIERADRERARKKRGKSAAVPRKMSVTERNGTEQTTTTTTGADESASPKLTVEPPLPALPRSKETAKRGLVPTEDEKFVLAHYRKVHPRRGPADDAQIRKVRKGLLSFTKEQLCEAIDGNKEDPWHSEKNKHELAYVLRDNDKISEFIDRYHAINAPISDGKGGLSEAGQRYFGRVA